MGTRGSHYCGHYYYDSLLPIYYQESRKVEGSGLSLCSGSRMPQARLESWHPSPEAEATRILLKHTCQTSRVNMKNMNMSAQYRAERGAGRRLAAAGAGFADPQGGSPWAGLACPAQGGVGSQTPAPS